MKGMQHRFAADFCSPIEVLVIERMVFCHWLFDRIAVDRCGRRIDQPIDTIGNASLHHVEGASHVHIECSPGIIVTLQQPQRSKVKDAVGAL